MTLRQYEIKKMLLEEMNNKIQYPAKFTLHCSYCTGLILQGEPFIFVGNKQKMCNTCQGEVTEFLEE